MYVQTVTIDNAINAEGILLFVFDQPIKIIITPPPNNLKNQQAYLTLGC